MPTPHLHLCDLCTRDFNPVEVCDGPSVTPVLTLIQHKLHISVAVVSSDSFLILPPVNDSLRLRRGSRKTEISEVCLL